MMRMAADAPTTTPIRTVKLKVYKNVLFFDLGIFTKLFEFQNFKIRDNLYIKFSHGPTPDSLLVTLAVLENNINKFVRLAPGQ